MTARTRLGLSIVLPLALARSDPADAFDAGTEVAAGADASFDAVPAALPRDAPGLDAATAPQPSHRRR